MLSIKYISYIKCNWKIEIFGHWSSFSRYPKHSSSFWFKLSRSMPVSNNHFRIVNRLHSKMQSSILLTRTQWLHRNRFWTDATECYFVEFGSIGDNSIRVEETFVQTSEREFIKVPVRIE